MSWNPPKENHLGDPKLTKDLKAAPLEKAAVVEEAASTKQTEVKTESEPTADEVITEKAVEIVEEQNELSPVKKNTGSISISDRRANGKTVPEINYANT